MNCLPDTQTLLWTLFEPEHLEKAGIKLELHGVTPDDFPALVRQSGFDILPLAEQDAAPFHNLPRLEHKDPFDRLLIWQAITHKLTFI